MKEKLLIVTALWGNWHVDMFLNKAMPTLIHDSNLGTLAKAHTCRWKIYTREESYERVERTAEIAREIIPVDVIVTGDTHYKDVWKVGTQDAKALEAMAMYLPPDVVWAKGSLAHISDLIDQGKKAIFISHPRGFPDEFDWYPRTAQELLRACRRNWHPLNRCLEVMSEKFTNHPEFVLWPITHGWIVRMFARELFVADPTLIGFNDSNLPDRMLDPKLMHVVGSSEQAFGVSLAPDGKDLWMHVNKNALRRDDVAEWLGNFHSYANEWVANQPILWKGGRVSDWEVERTVKASQDFIDSVYPKPALKVAA